MDFDQELAQATGSPAAAPAASSAGTTPDQFDQELGSAVGTPQVHSPGLWEEIKNIATGIGHVVKGTVTEPEKTNLELENIPDQGEVVPSVAKTFNTPDVNFMQAFSSAVPAAQAYLGDSANGPLSKFFYSLTLPGQLVARQAVNLLENANAMTSDEAKQLLSQDSVMGHDIVNHFWKSPDNIWLRSSRFFTGFLADIISDPMSVLKTGLTDQAKTAQIQGKTFENLGKLSDAERGFYKTAETIDKIITPENELMAAGAAGENPGRAVTNDMVMGDYVNKKISFDGLVSGLQVLPETKQTIREAYQAGQQAPGYFEEMASGERGLTVGFRLPFTNVVKEFQLPFSQRATEGLGSMATKFLDWNTKVLEPYQNKVTTWFTQTAKGVLSRTGWPVFDEKTDWYYGDKTLTDFTIRDWENNWRGKLKEITPDQVKAIVDQIEWNVEDPERVVKRHGYQPYDENGVATKYLQKLLPTQKDLDRVQGMPKDHLQFATEARHLQDSLLKQMIDRNMPIEELNPFDGPKGSVNSYIKHVFTDSYFNSVANVSEPAQAALDEVGRLTGQVSESAKGRQYRGSINAANDAYLAKNGVKTYVDDPIELTTRRLREMQDTIRRHDLMEAAVPTAIIKGPNEQLPRGYVKFNPKHFENLLLEQKDTTAEGGYSFKQFVPKYFQSGAPIYLPVEVYEKMRNIVNVPPAGSMMEIFSKGFDLFNKFFKNNALAGAATRGRDLFSNLVQLATHDMGDLTGSLGKALTNYMPFTEGGFKYTNELGQELKLTKDQLWRQALQDGVVGHGTKQLLDFGDLAEGVASNREVVPSKAQRYFNLYDAAMGWRLNRWVAKTGDDIPRMALYMDRLGEGYSRAAASQAVFDAFYNFSNQGPTLKRAGILFPFISFPVKTMELFFNQLKEGDIGNLNLPAKVSMVMEGAFVPDRDVRNVLNESLPWYNNIMNKTHGILMPGGKEVSMQLPWAMRSLDFFLSPEQNMHPLFQILGMNLTKHSMRDYQTITSHEDMQKETGDILYQYLPAIAREPLALLEMNGKIDFGGYFVEKYGEKYPSMGDEKQLHRFMNAWQFGKFMEQHKGENWLYDSLFGDLQDTDDSKMYNMKIEGARANYIAKHLRDLSLGVAAVSDMDKNVVTNLTAIQKQKNELARSYQQDLTDQALMPNPDFLKKAENLKALATNSPKARKLLEMHMKESTLKAYWNWYLYAQKKYPGINVLGTIFGADEYEYDRSLKPDLSKIDANKTNINDLVKSILTPEQPTPEAEEPKAQEQAPEENENE